MIERILVALDGSSFAEGALPAAEAVAARAGAELRLVSVLEMPPIFAYPEHRTEDRVRAEEYLERVASARRGRPSTAVRMGHVVDELLAEASAWGADLLVLATHGRGGLPRLWIGSVADRVVRTGDRPVLLVRPPEKGDLPAFAVPDVTVALDGSELAEAALAPAAELARLFGASLTLVRAVPFPAAPELTANPLAVESIRQMMQVEVGDAGAYLERVSGRLSGEGLTVARKVVEGLRPADAVLAEAKGLVVMTTRGRGGIERSLLGSVADRVIRQARRPVLLLPV